MFDPIVVGTDGSEGALEAVRSAGALASAFGVTSVHVVAAPGFSDTNVEFLRTRSLFPKAKAETLSLDATLDERLTEAGTMFAGGRCATAAACRHGSRIMLRAMCSSSNTTIDAIEQHHRNL